MQGEIWVESETGNGSNFCFTVAVTRAAGPPPEDARTLPARVPGGLEILVVDDNDSAREILQRMCSELGARVQVCGSGREALQLLQRDADAGAPAFDLVVTDWQMPQMNGLELVARIREIHGRQPAVLMVTAHGVSTFHSEHGIGELDVAEVLAKPVTLPNLRKAVAAAVSPRPRGTRHAIDQSATAAAGMASDQILAGVHLLLVEDNAFNQELAIDLLENRGIRVDVAEHGAEALEKLRQDSYDGVLMDCQMPVMDGYEATRRIREHACWQRLPIIAMTANVLPEDIASAHEAGMDDHIAKPLNVDDMFTTIARWVSPAVGATPGRPAEAPRAGPEASGPELPEFAHLDIASSLARLNGDRGLLARLLRKFTENQGDVAERIRRAMENGDYGLAEREAHTLKSVSGSIGAMSINALAAELEHTFRNRAPAASEVDRLAERVEVVIAEIAAWSPPASVASPTALDHDEVTHQLAQARDLVTEYDTDAEDKVRALLQQVPPGECRQHLQAALSTLERYDFDTALDALDSAAAVLS
jgi:CheY-like chemotaxis protein